MINTLNKSNIEVTGLSFYVNISFEIYIIVTYLHRENLKNGQMEKKTDYSDEAHT